MKLTASWAELEPFLRKARKQSEGSCKRHRSIFKTLSLYFSDKEITIQTFSVFLSELEESGISPAHQNNYIKIAKHIAAYYGQTFDFPFIDVPDSSPQYILTVEEIKKLADVKMGYRRYKERRWKHRALIYFMGNVGSRLSETLALEWKDLVQAQVPMVYFRAEITKTKRERICPIPGWLLEMLLKLPRETDKIFNRIEATNFREDLSKRCKEVGIPYNVVPSTFRDTSINNKLSYGMPIQEVGSYHGHVKIDTTFKYYTLIQAGQMATTLRLFDPSYQRDITYENSVESFKTYIEKRVNAKLFTYVYKTSFNSHKKKETWIGFVQK